MRQQKKVSLKPERFPKSPKEGLFVTCVGGQGLEGVSHLQCGPGTRERGTGIEQVPACEEQV